MRRKVLVQFSGVVSVVVPDHLSADDSSLLAEKLALARILSHLRQPRCPGG